MSDKRDAREPLEIDLAVLSDTGTQLGHNEDHAGKYVKSRNSGLVVVADGMATAEGAELASQRAVLALLQSFRQCPEGMPQTQRLIRAARSASFEVYDLAIVVPQLRGVSTTMTAVAVNGGCMTAAHVGDGRVYLIRDGRILQLSKDHTVAAEAAEQGRRGYENDQSLTRSLGRELLVPIDLFETDLVQGDTVIVCTDGLYRVLEESKMLSIVLGLDAATACRHLVDQANLVGTFDNLTVGVVRLPVGRPSMAQTRGPK